jgi:putative transposase
MSRRGNCYDNAPIESFWGTLKNELVYHHRFATREQAKRMVSEYIEMLYAPKEVPLGDNPKEVPLGDNRQRTQARLDYLSPVAFTQRYYLKQLAA